MNSYRIKRLHTNLSGYLTDGHCKCPDPSVVYTSFVKPSSVTASSCIANSLLLLLLQHTYTHL